MMAENHPQATRDPGQDLAAYCRDPIFHPGRSLELRSGAVQLHYQNIDSCEGMLRPCGS